MTGVTGISYENFVLDAVLTAGSQESSLPVANIATPLGAPDTDAWQTADGVLTTAGGAIVTVKPPTLRRTWRVAAVARTNLTPGASVTFTWKNIASPSDTTVSSVTKGGPFYGVGQVVAILPSDVTADYLTVSFDDPNNPDNHINVPLVWAGALWLPEYGRTSQSGYDAQMRVDQIETMAGQERTEARWRRRVLNLAFDALSTASELWSRLNLVDLVSFDGGNVLAIPDISSTNLNYEAVLGLARVSQRTHSLGTTQRIAASVQITERL